MSFDPYVLEFRSDQPSWKKISSTLPSVIQSHISTWYYTGIVENGAHIFVQEDHELIHKAIEFLNSHGWQGLEKLDFSRAGVTYTALKPTTGGVEFNHARSNIVVDNGKEQIFNVLTNRSADIPFEYLGVGKDPNDKD